jgi:dienelactone hydrolase
MASNFWAVKYWIWRYVILSPFPIPGIRRKRNAKTRAELDGSNNSTQRAAAEAILQGENATYQTTLYSGAEHGFAVRTDLTDKQKRFAQDSAYFQAVRWFDAWLKN